MTPARRRLIDALRAHGSKVNANGTAATCLAHDDRHASLSLGDRADGQGTLLDCKAGCSVEAVLDTVGLSMADLFNEPHHTTNEARLLVATYPYVDEAGTLLYEKLRYSPKDFRQRRPDDTGGWSWSLNGTRRVLYRLPEVIAARESGQPIYLAEGEKDADSLTRAGVTATTWTEGAWRAGATPKWRSDYTAQLAGAHVIIVRDRDEAGRHTATTIAHLLDGTAASVTVVDPAKGKDVTDHLAAGHTVDDLVPVDLNSETVPDPPEPSATVEANDSKVPAATRLVQLALDRYRFATTPNGEPYAVPLDGPPIVRMLRGSGRSLRAELADIYYETTGRAPGQQALADALGVLDGRALHGPQEELHMRVAQTDKHTLWLDLGEQTGRAIRITPYGWTIDTPPVLFRRTALTGPLPKPVRGGSLDELWDLANVAPEDRAPMLAVEVAALFPHITHPVVNINGEHGTGKTTVTKTFAGLLDPSSAQVRTPPRDVDTWITTAVGSWVIALENVSSLPIWLSDSLCKAATGDGDARRRLYTDGDIYPVKFRRCVFVNGIDLGAIRDDLADRMVQVNLHRISELRSEEELEAQWADAHPRILGAMLDLAVQVLQRLPHINLPDPPRMVDFGRILAAVDQVLGTNGLDRYRALAGDLAADAVTGDPVLAAITTLITQPWTGTAAELLDLITDEDARPGRDWPKTARAMTGILRRRAPSLRRLGWTVDDLGRGGKAVMLRWYLAPPEAGNEAGNRQATGRQRVLMPASTDADACLDNPDVTCEDAKTAGKAGKAGKNPPVSLCWNRREEGEGEPTDPPDPLGGEERGTLPATPADDQTAPDGDPPPAPPDPVDNDDEAPGVVCSKCGGPMPLERVIAGFDLCVACYHKHRGDTM